MEIIVRNIQQKIEFSDEYDKFIRECIEEIRKMEGISENAEVGVLITDDEGIRALNRDYRGLDQATDVLSFSVFEKGEGEPELDVSEEYPLVLGDIVISAETAVKQSKQYGHSIQRELVFLVTHGMLHLLGYDHKDSENEDVMRDKQRTILEKLNLDR